MRSKRRRSKRRSERTASDWARSSCGCGPARSRRRGSSWASPAAASSGWSATAAKARGRASGAMTTTATDLQAQGAAAKEASRTLARLSADVKSQALRNVARDLLAREAGVLAGNGRDIEAGRQAGLSEAVLDRLLLTRERLEGIAADVQQVSLLPDPVGEVFDMRTLPNGLQVGKKRVPLGVIGAVYESRPNVTVDISVLCLKSGNAIILRGGKEAVHSNSALAKIIQSAAYRAGVPEGAVQFIESTDRALVGQMLKLRDTIDLVIPRGGAELISHVAQNAAMPVVTGGI